MDVEQRVKVGQVEGSSKELASELACSRAGDESPHKQSKAGTESVDSGGRGKQAGYYRA